MTDISSGRWEQELLDQCAAQLRDIFSDTYHQHVQVSDYLAAWATSVETAAAEPGLSEADQEYLGGYARALSDVVQHLKRGDALPGGPLAMAALERFAA